MSRRLELGLRSLRRDEMKPESSPRKKGILAAAAFSGFCSAMGLVTNIFGSRPLDIGELCVSLAMLIAAAYLSVRYAKTK
jgi:hypothetical protein